MTNFTATQGRYLVHSHLLQPTRLSARRIGDHGGFVRLAAVGEPDGEDAGEEGTDFPSAWSAPFAPCAGP